MRSRSEILKLAMMLLLPGCTGIGAVTVVVVVVVVGRPWARSPATWPILR